MNRDTRDPTSYWPTGSMNKRRSGVVSAGRKTRAGQGSPTPALKTAPGASSMQCSEMKDQRRRTASVQHTR